MAKRPHENGRQWGTFLILLVVSCSCFVAYLCVSPLLHTSSSSQAFQAHVAQIYVDEDGPGCCRGLEHIELWGDAVNWGSDFLANSTGECCDACKAHLKCNSWVYCADQAKCGSTYRQCWLKRQKDPLNPEVHDSGPSNPWTSGLVFDKDVGIVGLAIGSGSIIGDVIRMNLLPDCSPKSVLHILELARLAQCSGCRFYRADGRGKLWDSNGTYISKTVSGPPYAVLQGTLQVQHVPFKGISKEHTPAIRRGMVGWVGEGPDFFISLADHFEWPRKHTVFATVVQEDMARLDSLAEMPTTTATWEEVLVEVLDKPVDVKLQRIPKE